MPKYPWEKEEKKEEVKKNSPYPWDNTTSDKPSTTDIKAATKAITPKFMQPLLQKSSAQIINELPKPNTDSFKTAATKKDTTKTMVVGKGKKVEVKPQGKIAPKDLKRPDNPFAPLLVNALNTASLGLLERNTDAIDQLREKAPIRSTIGSMAGYLAPFSAAKGAVVKGAQTVGKRILTDAAVGAGVDTATELIKGKNDVKTAVKNVAIGAGAGILADVGLTALGKIGKLVAENIKAGKLAKIPAEQVAATLDNTSSKTTAIKSAGQYKVKNTALDKAINEYNAAVETIQNYFKTNQLRADEMARIKTDLGIDLDKLVKNIEDAEKGVSVSDIGKWRNLANAAGVKTLPKIKPITVPKPQVNIKPPQIENKALKSAVNEVATTAENAARKSETGFKMETWKDKPKLALKRETMERNLYDIIPDKEEAKKVIDTYIEPIKKAEADNIRSLNTLRNEVKAFGIKPGSQESELIQKYGEGVITLDEVKAQTKNWQKVEEATKYFRKKYDELLEKANEVLTRNGYKPIPKRKNYFPHQGEIDGIMKALGLESYELPTDINGLTAGFTPGKSFFSHALQRKGDKTAYDAIRGFDNYIEGINRIIYHTDNIKRLRTLEKDIRKTFEGTTHLTNFVTELREYTNLLAGKKSILDRGMEELVGRRIYRVADAIRKQLGANMVGANVSSALTNFIPLTQALATTDKESFIRGMVGTIANIFKNDGFIEQSDYLVRRFGSDKLVTSAWQKPGKALGWMFRAVDGFTAQTITRAKYLEGLKKGLSESEALKQANNYAAKIMADRSIGQVPTLFTSKTLAPLTQFQLETNNQISFLFKDLPQMMKGNKAAMASAYAQVALYSYLFNNLYERIVGRRPAFDVLGVVKDAIEDYNNDNIDNKEATWRTLDNVANQLPFASFYTGGRIPMSSAIPDIKGIFTNETTLGKEISKPILNIALPTGGTQLSKTYKGLGTVLRGGAYTDSGRLRYPVDKNLSNFIKGGLFGPSALPETQEYYDNKRAPLGEKQTEQIEKARAQGKNVKYIYNKILEDRKKNK